MTAETRADNAQPVVPVQAFCINCKHYRERIEHEVTVFRFCEHPAHDIRDFVTGKGISISCIEARARAPYANFYDITKGRCGPTGQFFEERTCAPISTTSAITEASEHGSANNA